MIERSDVIEYNLVFLCSVFKSNEQRSVKGSPSALWVTKTLGSRERERGCTCTPAARQPNVAAEA